MLGDDLKNFKARQDSLLTQAAFWLGIAAASFVVYLIPEQQGAADRLSIDAVKLDRPSDSAIPMANLRKPNLATVAPYQPCPKLRSGKWLKWEVAQQTGQGWIVTCSYEGDAALFARDEMRL